MKTKTLIQVADLSSALDHLEIARKRAVEAGEPNIANLIGNVAQKLEILKSNVQAVTNA